MIEFSEPFRFIKVARQGAVVTRLHTVPTIGQENVAQHSWGVAMLVLALTQGKASAELMKAALMHDLCEQHTGDIPATVKWRSSELAELLSEMEREFAYDRGFTYDITDEEKVILKWADTLDLMFFSYDQLCLGNTHAEQVFDRLADRIANGKLAYHRIGMIIYQDLSRMLKKHINVYIHAEE